jgi:hypothetical protein
MNASAGFRSPARPFDVTCKNGRTQPSSLRRIHFEAAASARSLTIEQALSRSVIAMLG